MDLSGTGFIGSNSNGVGKFTAGLPRDFSCRGTLKEEGSSHLPLVWLKLNPTTRLRSIFHYLNTLRNLGSDEIKRPVVQTHPHPTRRVFQTSGDIMGYSHWFPCYMLISISWGYINISMGISSKRFSLSHPHHESCSVTLVTLVIGSAAVSWLVP